MIISIYCCIKSILLQFSNDKKVFMQLNAVFDVFDLYMLFPDFHASVDFSHHWPASHIHNDAHIQ